MKLFNRVRPNVQGMTYDPTARARELRWKIIQSMTREELLQVIERLLSRQVVPMVSVEPAADLSRFGVSDSASDVEISGGLGSRLVSRVVPE